MPFRFKPTPQLVMLMAVSVIALTVKNGAAIAVAQLYMIGGVGSLLLQAGNMTVGPPREPGAPMAPTEIALTFALGVAFCFAGLLALELAFGPTIVVTAETSARIPYETMQNPTMRMVLAAWNLLVLGAGSCLALLLTGCVLAAYEAIRKRRIKPTPSQREPSEPA